MEAHTITEIETLAQHLREHHITYIFPYVSYLKPEGFFNPTFDHAADFVAQMKSAAPEIQILGWIGIPLQITTSDGVRTENRLEDAAVRHLISDFSNKMVTELGFDGVHLNAEMSFNDDPHLIETLDAIRKALPEGKQLSIATHALRPTEQITSIPYPIQRHHWTADYLREVAQHVDQIALMAYDSGLFFPADYRAWMAYQTQAGADALKDTHAQLLIGFSVSDENTPSHNTSAETIPDALFGIRWGLEISDMPERVDGIAIYAHWEMNPRKWELVDGFP